jgi:hypothetical protein
MPASRAAESVRPTKRATTPVAGTTCRTVLLWSCCQIRHPADRAS